MANKDRMTFEEAAKELQISEDELEGLVANGEIASIKEGDTFFFKPEVVSQFKKSRKTEPTIILADEDMEILDVMEEIDLETKDTSKPAAKPAAPASRPAAAPATSSDILNLDDLEVPDLQGAEEISIEPRKAEKAKAAAPEAAPEDTVLNLDGLLEDDGSEGTTPIPGAEIGSRMPDDSSDITVEGNISDETLLDTDLLEIGDEEDSFKLDASTEESLSEPTEATLLRGGGARAMQMKRKQSHAKWTIMLTLAVLILFVPMAILFNTLYISVTEGTLLPSSGKSAFQWALDLSDFPVVGKGWVEKIADLFG